MAANRRSGRPLIGLATVLAVAAVIAVAVGLFRGSFTSTVPVTVLSHRAGLVMNADAKVKWHGAQVGSVKSIETLPGGGAAIHLAMDPSYLDIIPSDVRVDIASSTVFGSKYVDLVPPAESSRQPLQAGQTLNAEHVTVEINTVFEQLSSVLAKIEPAKLNQTLGALATALDGRGDQIGQTMSDFDAFLAKIEPSLPAMEHELSVAPTVIGTYADVAQDLVDTVEAATTVGQTLVAEQEHLDTLLVSVIGLSDIGNEVLGGNSQAISDVMELLVPTTDLLNQYHEALNCGLGGAVQLAKAPGTPVPGGLLLQTVVLGQERYRYPQNLPKVAAKGGPQCTDLPKVGFQKSPPFVITDVNANPAQYGNQGIVLNSDGLKQLLFGPIDGPPRNGGQIGHPG
ncbi:MCE family protein [Mycolicibacterium vaccae]|jgi:phospholipid/cholesterol/gamma-HCH transport system substrate-binding protein|uniref:Virulence factor Mce family protein n=1 Tax=Mycolicibacterium vaccae ATCC 25954 TaxID=1194972 RepID=K0UPC9_MYCVA|nr:MCE family protein [Mycolicibacterium vaccae]ANI38833.1 virulence factor Mce family protein [Mycolicibacterium vaccae 95051]EJZ08952.1 virulence factor Mce family protein [Mycolicibacterium vaccae ATCC 25954]